MPNWLFALFQLLLEFWSFRRDARIRFLKTEVEILRRKLGGNRVVLSPEDCARLLAIGAEFDHRVAGLIGIVTSRTYSRWVVEQLQGRQPKPVGRPKIRRSVRDLVTRLAKENAGWGYRRIFGELRKLRLHVARSTISRILRDAGLTPSPTRRGCADETIWRKFIHLHVNTLVACDFFTKNVVTPMGVRIAYCLAFIHVGTRKVFLSPATFHPHEKWVQQQARNMMMWLEEERLECRFVIHDRDTKFSAAFRRLLNDAGIQYVRTPLLSPDANAFVEAWIGSIKRECLNHFLCFSLGHLDYITQNYVHFYNMFRPHQALGNRTLAEATIGPPAGSAIPPQFEAGQVRCLCFLGGLLRHYHRTAA